MRAGLLGSFCSENMLQPNEALVLSPGGIDVWRIRKRAIARVAVQQLIDLRHHGHMLHHRHG